MLSYERLSIKPLLFKSFTGLTVKEFDDIFDRDNKMKEKHELQRLSTKRKYIKREREYGAIGRPFKIDIKKKDF